MSRGQAPEFPEAAEIGRHKGNDEADPLRTRSYDPRMRIVGLLLILFGAAGALVFSKPDLRWESVGAAVVGVVLILSAKPVPTP
jgi:hypothetical protein